ncbi:class I adenylate-forming enzyme family protein [Bythopirellula polymerisocia]|uniref:Long-chain-fatty-acid--CoA ligase n=1 Tax=Bythopirellula polymerisocia TaxID=2528003 RepID=A0A5C6CWI2_9BACT|nr:class I adenylate-forming enzyme family protein [Bythopirellula polymerisocia]TWU27346.1 Long-chain-fatty-acid--CoA ligase [Bythopirellula polymerisocia]
MPLTGPLLEKPVVLTQLLQRGLQLNSNELALVSADFSWTWYELDLVSSRLAANLLGLGLRPGDRAASLMPNRTSLIIFYLACIKAGLVATPLNYRYQAPEIDHALEVSEAAILLAHVERDADLDKSKLVAKLPLGRITYGATGMRSPSFDELLQLEPKSLALPEPSLDTPIFIFFTSGSTGKPKGVTHTHETFGWMLASAIVSFEITPDDVFLPGSSISHIAASLMALAGLAAGIRVEIARTFDGDEVLPLLDRTKPTMLCMLPAALFNVVRDHGATRHHFRALRACFAGGDKVSAELEREFVELVGIEIDELYGMSEIGLATINPPSGKNKVGSIGKLAPGYQASVRDVQGREVPVGSEGKLWIKSPINTIGYWKRPEATAETIVDGWLDTGDIVRADEDGYLWFAGRKKQIIVHDGSNICPQEVEESLVEHPAVAEAGVVGIHDVVHGENVRAYITLVPGADRPTIAELIKFSRERVGYKAPEEIVVLDEMPLNATGKTDRVALKRLAESGHVLASQ